MESEPADAAPLILGFDTSGPWCGAVLLRGQNCLADCHHEMPKGQAETLFPVLEDVLARGGAEWRDLAAIGVGIGPGNFTGIRIAVSAARGLALSLDIPVVGVSLLEALALGHGGPVLSALSAPREQAYIEGFGTARPVARQLIPINEIPADIAETGLACVGTAGKAVADHLGARHEPAVYAPASAIARIAADRWPSSHEPPAPLYLKPADAAPPREAPPVILDA